MAHKRNSERRWRNLRVAILAQSDVCHLCGKPGADTIDHVIPVALGGDQWDPTNLRPAHGRKRPGCPGNYSLGARLGNQLRTAMTSTPSRNWRT